MGFMYRQFLPSAGILGLISLLITHSAFGTVTAASIESTEDGKLRPLPIHTDTTRNIVDALASRHYISATLNDELSARIYDAYIEDLDPSRSYFLQSDIDEFEKYRYLMDNDLRRGDIETAFRVFNRYHERLIYRLIWIVERLKVGLGQFNFSVDESLILDRSEEAWAKNDAELDELWRKRLKNSVLNLKLAGKQDDKILELLLKRYENRLSRSKQTNSEDVYQLYMNAFTSTYDPHTQYFSPRTAENFNINMSLSLEGIGAVLQREEEFTKVVSLVPAGPADKSKLLHPEDKIIAVGQGVEGEMIDVIGWRLDEVVQLVRGKKNSVVRLEIIESDAKDQSSHIIQITRNTVKLEEQSAKSEIIEIEQFGHVRKIGVIDIPTFYIDFKALQKGDKNYKSTTRDVRNLLRELKQAEVDGIIIDLRDNGGGSLQEANFLTGLFINRGPTVQIRTKSNRVDLLYDRDARTTYDGPLAVLVNRLSASASEIFAGAIQDYQRGVVIGSQTFGKGTVQSLIPLNRGQLKLTQAKFYRISGESTQHQGIIPDILFPASYDSESIGESTLDEPLPWDEIPPTDYQLKSAISQVMPELRTLHEQRTRNDPEFTFMQEALQYRKELNEENEVSLNQETRIQRKESTDTFWVTLENKKRIAQGLKPINSLDELDDNELAGPETAASGITSPPLTESAAEEDTEQQSIQGNEMAGLNNNVADIAQPEEAAGPAVAEDPDAYLLETGNILLNMMNLPARTAEKSVRDAAT
jgi:carboxyl-terminal processing protease